MDLPSQQQEEGVVLYQFSTTRIYLQVIQMDLTLRLPSMLLFVLSRCLTCFVCPLVIFSPQQSMTRTLLQFSCTDFSFVWRFCSLVEAVSGSDAQEKVSRVSI